MEFLVRKVKGVTGIFLIIETPITNACMKNQPGEIQRSVVQLIVLHQCQFPGFKDVFCYEDAVIEEMWVKSI